MHPTRPHQRNFPSRWPRQTTPTLFAVTPQPHHSTPRHLGQARPGFHWPTRPLSRLSLGVHLTTKPSHAGRAVGGLGLCRRHVTLVRSRDLALAVAGEGGQGRGGLVFRLTL